LADVEKDVILEINKARTNPKKYADFQEAGGLPFQNSPVYAYIFLRVWTWVNLTHKNPVFIPVKTPFIPIITPFIPVKAPLIPVKAPFIPIITPFIPVKAPLIPVKTPLIPVKMPLIPIGFGRSAL
jgi:hypothetical protein